MGLTIGEVAALTGVTVRTLHHYDEIRLVPAGRTPAGHRRYDEDAVERLQEVLFWRELDLPLDEIARLLADPDHDRMAVLRDQHQLLVARARRTTAMIKALEATMDAHDKGTRLTDREMLEVFGADVAEHHRERDDEARRRWGETEAWTESRRRTSTYDRGDWERIKAEGDEAVQALARAKRDGAAPDSPDAMDAAEAARLHIDRWFYPCPHAMHVGLAGMYVADARFTATYEAVEPGLAQYVHDAVVANAARHT